MILLTCTGFVEELMFRGVMQRTAVDRFGFNSLIYVSLLFAVLHMGYQNWLDVAFVFVVAVFFSWTVKKQGRLLE